MIFIIWTGHQNWLWIQQIKFDIAGYYFFNIMKNRRNGGFFVYFKGLVTPFRLSGKKEESILDEQE